MKKLALVTTVVLAVVGGYLYLQRGEPEAAAGPGGGGGRGGFTGGGGFRGFGGGGSGGPRLPMTVELSAVTRSDLSEQITVVGNLIGAATVEAAPKLNGRLESVGVRMGDRVQRGQVLARVEDSEIREQVRQAEASFRVAEATVRQREADLQFAETNLQRSRSLFDRQLIAQQALEDAQSRQQASAAQLDLARAQLAQSAARLDELRINLDNTAITSPVTGYVGRRTLDAGAWVTPNSAFLSVVDISVVRLVANVVERDLRRIMPGLAAEVDVDAYPDEQFMGRVARVAPVLDPATRTAQIEVDIENPEGRLKPGMYARVRFTVDERMHTLVIPTNAMVAVNRQSGVFLPGEGNVARFQPIQTGLQNQEFVEILGGLSEGDQIVTTGAAALREGDQILVAGQLPTGRGERGRGAPGAADGEGFEGRGGRQGFEGRGGREGLGFGGRGDGEGRGAGGFPGAAPSGGSQP